MPMAVAGPSKAVKRKGSTLEKKSLKRARSESSENDGQAQILLLENEIFESKKNYNNIAKLIKILTADNDNADDSVVAAISLCRVFTRLTAAGDLVSKSRSSEKEEVVVNWLRDRYTEYKTAILDVLGEEGVSATALTLCMRLLKTEGESVQSDNNYYRFPAAFLTDITKALLDQACDPNARKEFSEKYVEEYDDIRFYTLEAIQKILDDSALKPSRQLFDNALEMLTSIDTVPESKEELEDFYVPAPKKTTHALYSLMKHKKRAQGAWLALMKMGTDRDQRKTILGLVSDTIAPWFMQPELLMDFLTDCYDAGGSTSLLALSGVFYLIQEKNLDYPAFYRKLYSLLDSDILHSKHRSRFFRLLDTFLGSTHLPAVLVASFIKRLSRLALSAPPAGIVVVVPWIYNLLKKHPTCTFMIHRETRIAEERQLLENEGMADPFVMEEEDPMETNAIKSSLWELVMLQSHYHPNVATIAKIISEQFTKHAYNIEDFLDHTYGSMLESELSKDIKKVPVIEYEIPKTIFTKHDVGSDAEDSLLVKLWDFS